jgi:hypothetical protein
MRPRRFPRFIPLLVLAVLVGAGCWGSGDLLTDVKQKFHGVVPPPVAPPPLADSPTGAVRLLQWCWEHRNVEHYRTIFTEDFIFACASADSAGNPYRNVPWGPEDELVFAQNLFVSGTATEPPASSIMFDFYGDLTPQRDFRDGRIYPWHQIVQVTNFTLTVNRTDGSAYRASDGALFFLVRGDSAAIPADLVAQGAQPDSAEWYIERWEDQATAFAPASAAVPAQPLPTRKTTVCLIKSLYR